MIKLLMLVYLLLVAGERKPKRRWFRRKPEALRLSQTGVDRLPAPAPEPPAVEDVAGALRERIHEVAAAPPIPTTLVGAESAAARIILQGPRPRPTVLSDIGVNEAERLDTPIGRTLTCELLSTDPSHVPAAALRHIPVEDPARENLNKPAAELPKGKPTPKRSKKKADMSLSNSPYSHAEPDGKNWNKEAHHKDILRNVHLTPKQIHDAQLTVVEMISDKSVARDMLDKLGILGRVEDGASQGD